MGREDVPQSTSAVTKQSKGGGEKNAERKTGRPKAVNQVGERSPQNPEKSFLSWSCLGVVALSKLARPGKVETYPDTLNSKYAGPEASAEECCL
ncbi:hypothetical protein TNCV_1524971 [Trichonephila clavipes]|nr:hypothetical protein TNCV_1524971 [Trichonephila clavipes]